MGFKTLSSGKKVLPFLTFGLGFLQIALVLLSWIISTVSPSLPVKSMLSGEGIRWFLGGFTDCMASPLLVWLLLCSVAAGAFSYSNLYSALRLVFSGSPVSYRQRHALFTVLAAMLMIIIVVILLAFIPHAVLLGVTGSLFPSAFSAGLVPVVAFTVTFLSIVYGFVVGRFTDANSVFRSLYVGLYMSAPLFPVYILAVQLYASVRYVFF